MPVVSNLRNPCLKSRHWALIESVIGQKLPPGIDFVKTFILNKV